MSWGFEPLDLVVDGSIGRKLMSSTSSPLQTKIRPRKNGSARIGPGVGPGKGSKSGLGGKVWPWQ